MSPIARVINLNNRAVTLLRHGQQKRSLDSFRLALQVFQELQAAQSDTIAEEGGRGDAGEHDTASIQQQQQGSLLNVDGDFLHVQSVEIKMQLEGSDDPEDAYLHLFNRALVLTRNAVKHQDAIVASVLYNLALVSHLRGVQTRSQARYSTSLKLYRMAYEIIQSHDDQSIFEDILILALVNNLGHIQSRLGQSEEARRQNNFLRVAIGMAPPDGTDDDDEVMAYSPQVDEQDYFFFYLNALEERVSAPAA